MGAVVWIALEERGGYQTVWARLGAKRGMGLPVWLGPDIVSGVTGYITVAKRRRTSCISRAGKPGEGLSAM